MKLLIVEDDKKLNRGLVLALKKEGYEVFGAENLLQARKFLVEKPDLILLDIRLPDGNGISFCQEIGVEKTRIPVIFLTANDGETDMVRGFQAGAEDYIVKPFSLAVLKERIKVVLRRYGETLQTKENEIVEYKGLRMDFTSHRIWKEENEIVLTSREYCLLEILVKNRGQIMTKQSLLECLWDVDGNFVEENTLFVTIRRLRDKIEEDKKHPIFVKTVFGIGYTFGD